VPCRARRAGAITPKSAARSHFRGTAIADVKGGFCVVTNMGNSTKVCSPVLHNRLAALLATYQGVLRADEQRLQDAMRDFERSCWEQRLPRVAVA
jgi:hypothetical protein